MTGGSVSCRSGGRSALHAVLLRLAGRVPDRQLWALRDQACDEPATVVTLDLLRAVVDLGIPLTWGELDVVDEILHDVRDRARPVDPVADTQPEDEDESGDELGDEDAAVFLELFQEELDHLVALAEAASVETIDRVPVPFIFTPAPAQGNASLDPGGVRELVLAAVAREPGAVGVWQAWRSGGDAVGGHVVPATEDVGVRVVLVEADRDADLSGLTARVQRELAVAGAGGDFAGQGEVVGVEVYPVGGSLPAYHAQLRAQGVLLGARSLTPPVFVSRDVEPARTAMNPGEPGPSDPGLSDDVLRTRVLDYLRAGEPVLLTTARAVDPRDPARGPVVPQGLRTDGSYVWSEALAHDLAEHGVLPPEPLLARALAHAGPQPPVVDGVALTLARQTVLGDATTEGDGAVLFATVRDRAANPDRIDDVDGAADPLPDLRVAQAFDAVDEQGLPTLTADRTRLPSDLAEHEWILDYLRAGEVVLSTDRHLDDVLDPGCGRRVPLNLRTDGSWIWSEASSWYLEHHEVAPDPGLLEHIRSAGYLPPEPVADALQRAVRLADAIAESAGLADHPADHPGDQPADHHADVPW